MPADLVVECVLNVSEGCDLSILNALAKAGGSALLDVHRDPDHHRSVLTLASSSTDVAEAARAVVSEAVRHVDISTHVGVHPRFGAADVVPFVPFAPFQRPNAAESDPVPLVVARKLRDELARWAGTTLQLPCFLYGPCRNDGERSLPELRRGAFSAFGPDQGPPRPHPTAGAAAVGARNVLIAYNVFLADVTMATAKELAASLRIADVVRALAFEVGGRPQVSFNLLEPDVIGPAQVYDRVATAIEAEGGSVSRAELVGLIPIKSLESIPVRRWRELDLSESSTIEARLAEAGS